MEAAQETLGAHQDTVVIRTVLRRPHAPTPTTTGSRRFTYGRLHAAEEQRADHATRKFLASVDDGWGRRPSWLH